MTADLNIALAMTLLLVAAVVAIATRRLRLPYSVGLMAAGIVLAVMPWRLTPPLSRDLIFLLFLPPLVFEAAIQIPWRPFRRELPLLSVLVTLGVVIAAGIVAVGMHALLGWSWIGAALFGVLIAATDPVSVIAAFKELTVPHRLHLLVESESLLNDGVAAVGFAVLAAIAGGAVASPGGIAVDLLLTVVGGVVSGVVVAVPLLLLAGRSTDRLVEVTLTMVIAYGSFLLAEHFHLSGVLATLTAGLIVGNWGFPGPISDDGKRGVLNYWEYIAFLINSVIFLLIGGGVAHLPIVQIVVAGGAAIGLSLIGRAAGVYLLSPLFARSSLRVPGAYQHVLFWGGLRGALALALALALPPQVAERHTILAVAFAVVAFSILVQGLTMRWLLERLGLLAQDESSSSSRSA